AVSYARSLQIGAYAGSNTVTAASSADTTKILFTSSGKQEFKSGGINTLFLCGNTGAYEGIFINNDNIMNRTDSVIGIRFINLSPNSSPLNITLSTTPTVNEAANLAYKQITDFKTYPATQNITSYVFQIRDGGGVLLASYTLPKNPPVSPYTTVTI